MSDRLWAEINAKPLGKHRFGAAVQERARDRIPTLCPITEPTLRMTRRELRQPPCSMCGNNGRTHCGCEVLDSIEEEDDGSYTVVVVEMSQDVIDPLEGANQ